MQTAHLSNINLFVSDADKAYQFYKRVFGFEDEPSMAHPPDFLVLNVGSATFSFQSAQAVGMNQEPVGGIELGFEVPDVDVIAARLQEQGGQIERSNQMAWGDSVDCRDLDGHRLTIYRRR